MPVYINSSGYFYAQHDYKNFDPENMYKATSNLHYIETFLHRLFYTVLQISIILKWGTTPILWSENFQIRKTCACFDPDDFK